jgi:hypothetical protein
MLARKKSRADFFCQATQNGSNSKGSKWVRLVTRINTQTASASDERHELAPFAAILRRKRLIASSPSEVVKPSSVGESSWNKLIGSSRVASASGLGGVSRQARASSTKQTSKVTPRARW